MPKTVHVATVQMDATPAPLAARLARATRLVQDAAAAGAQIVVLPELFNSGYSYAPDQADRAEALDGPTLRWMTATTAQYGIYLAGSLLLHDAGEIYNALLLVAPDGRRWRYDKQYPWGWERATFRPGRGDVVIADTALGRIGLLICWDVAHRRLWARYAGQIDWMLISSCPAEVSDPVYVFANGARLTMDRMGPLLRPLHRTSWQLFGPMLNQQTAWLGVPAAQSVGTGQITTPIPRPLTLLLALLPSAPWLLRLVPQGASMQMECGFVAGCKVVAADGTVLTELAQEAGEQWTSATITLAPDRPQPVGIPPPSLLPPAAYVTGDTFLPSLMRPVYAAAQQLATGGPPVHGTGRRWLAVVGVGLLALLALGYQRHRTAAK